MTSKARQGLVDSSRICLASGSVVDIPNSAIAATAEQRPRHAIPLRNLNVADLLINQPFSRSPHALSSTTLSPDSAGQTAYIIAMGFSIRLQDSNIMPASLLVWYIWLISLLYT